MKENMLGYLIDAGDADTCCDDIFAKMQLDTKTWFACFNPHSYAVSNSDSSFAEALRSADWLVPDGIGVIIASRLLGGDITKRVTGSDVFFGLHSRMNAAGGMKVFFLGSSEETLSKIRQRMRKDYPNIELVGTYSPPFATEYTEIELEEMLSIVNIAKPDVLWVGMTAPKQEKWIFENLPFLHVKFAGAIGAVFDFYTGQVKRSSPMYQKLGLEWLPRLIQQPRRLWRRTFISAPAFLLGAIKEKMTNK